MAQWWRQTITYVSPRNVWGQPDLQGVWNFSSNVPFQRPQQFGEREFMTDDEIAAMRARLAEADAASDQAVPSADPNSPGGYNDFWVESAGITDRIRTSHLVYPADGRLPDRVAGSAVQFGGLGPDVPVSDRFAIRLVVLPRMGRKIADCRALHCWF